MIQPKPSEKGEIITYLSRMGDVLDDIKEWGKIAILLIGTVYTIVNGNKSYISFWECNLCIIADLQIITS